MKRFATAFLAVLIATAAVAADSKLNVIADKSSIGFIGSKLVGKHEGQFGKFDGHVAVNAGKPTAVDFTIDLTTVKTDNSRLDRHLQSADFWDVANHPAATFKSTKITQLSANQYEVAGNFTLRGKTQPISFRASTEQAGADVRVTSEFTIDRQRWDVAYKGAADNLIKDAVVIKLDLTFPAK